MDYNYSNEIMHSGIKGMKWGVRRYQNKDGSLTDAGKKRYGVDAKDNDFTKYDEATRKYYKTSKKNGRSDLEFNAEKYAREDNERLRRSLDDSSRLSNELKRVNEKAIKNAPKNPRLDLSKMSDKELRDQINRELLERQYNDVFNPPQVSKGREVAGKILDTAGDTLAIAGSAVALAISIQTLRKGLG